MAAGFVVEAFLAHGAEVYAANPKRAIGLLLSIPGLWLKVLTPVVTEAAFLITRTAAFQGGRVGCAQGSLKRKLGTEAKLGQLIVGPHGESFSSPGRLGEQPVPPPHFSLSPGGRGSG